jgi:hypothetical protein
MPNWPIVIKVSNINECLVSTITISSYWFETVTFGPNGEQNREVRSSSVEDALVAHHRQENKVINGKVNWR